MKANSFFEEGKNDIVQTGRKFMGWFGDISLTRAKNRLYYADLDEYLTTKEILSKIKPGEVMLDDVVRVIEEKKDLIKDRFNVFFVRDAGDVIRIIDVYWSEVGWCVCSRDLDETKRCVVGRVFSSIPVK